jgi:hypothetical protein
LQPPNNIVGGCFFGDLFYSFGKMYNKICFQRFYQAVFHSGTKGGEFDVIFPQGKGTGTG